MKVAFVTCRNLESKYGDEYQAFPNPIVELLSQRGFLVIPMVNIALNIEELIKFFSPNLIVLTGGEDIGLNTDRDEVENLLLDYALANSAVRIFGICRGMQFMVKKLNGTIGVVDGHSSGEHEIFGSGFSGEVNSYHRNGIMELPDCFEVTVRSSDGVIEAIHHKELPWVGWMWHPERMKMPAQMELEFNLAIGVI
jgi:gamma-glutamyl-gamma-aminobutyrate hydrolase PuuD